MVIFAKRLAPQVEKYSDLLRIPEEDGSSFKRCLKTAASNLFALTHLE
jgi:hypothetical protein